MPPPPGEGEEQRCGRNYSLQVSADLSRMIGSLVVELTTPDVLYNNRFWPEEESLKMTVERCVCYFVLLEEMLLGFWIRSDKN